MKDGVDCFAESVLGFLLFLYPEPNPNGRIMRKEVLLAKWELVGFYAFSLEEIVDRLRILVGSWPALSL